MASLTGQSIANTYDSLLKLTDNEPLTSSLKIVTDGLGNSSVLQLSTLAATFTGQLNLDRDISWNNNTGYGLLSVGGVRFLSYTLAGGVNIGTGAVGVTVGSAVSGTSATFSGNGAFGTTSGNLEVGYGVTQGLYKLDVNGTGRFSGSLEASGNIGIRSSDGGGKILKFIGGVTTYNGLIANNENYANTIEITASSAVGTTTFNRNIAKFNLSDLSTTLAGTLTGTSATFSDLAGTGSRAVLADASGVLSAPVSDISVKQNIVPIGYGLNEIVKMNPVWFDFIDSYKNFGEDRQNGNIAQEMAEIIPEAVFITPSTGKMGINYDQLHAVYIKAIQELKAEIDILKAN